MENKNIINIINEEFSSFDFLNNDKEINLQDEIKLLQNVDFQKQLIIDSIWKFKEKFKIIEQEPLNIGGNWEGNTDDSVYITIDYYVKFEYKYDPMKEPILIGLDFGNNGEDNIIVNKVGQYTDNSVNSSVGNYDISWENVTVKLLSSDNDIIEFKAYNNEKDLRLKEKFFDTFIGDIIVDRLNGA
jgi:hypothetical protein